MKKLTRDELVTALRNDTTCDDCICAAECDHDTCLLYAAAADMLENHETERLALVKVIEKLRKQVDELTKAGLIATDKANQAIAESDAAIKLLRSMYWCYGCVHLGQPLSANSGCDLDKLLECNEGHDLYEFGVREDA